MELKKSKIRNKSVDVPVVPMIKDFNLLNIKTSIFHAFLSFRHLEPFNQDEINGSSLEALLLSVS